jgi:hypothetical protein
VRRPAGCSPTGRRKLGSAYRQGAAGHARRRWRAGCGIDVGVRARAMVPTTQRTIVVGRFGLPRSRAVGSLSVTAPAGVGGRPCRGAGDGRSGSHGPAAPIAFSEPGRPPYGARGRASLCPSRTTGSDLSRSQFRFRQNASNIPIHETAPSFLNDGYPTEICDRGRLPWRNPA